MRKREERVNDGKVRNFGEGEFEIQMKKEGGFRFEKKEKEVKQI